MQRLRFLHIPKTAGTTFTEILLRQYCGRKSFAFTGDLAGDLGRYSALSDGERGRIRLFFGHAPLSTGEPRIDACPVITFLREPVSRVTSFCQHVAEGKSPYLASAFPPASFDLDRFLESGNYELSNLQTKMLLEPQAAADFSAGAIPDAIAAELALEVLSTRVSTYGLQEYFDESLMVFRERFNWRLPFYAIRNRSAEVRKLSFAQRHLDRIREANGADILLHAAARNLFCERLAATPSLGVRLRRFKALNARFGGMAVQAHERVGVVIRALLS